jgi:hypothetical protein
MPSTTTTTAIRPVCYRLPKPKRPKYSGAGKDRKVVGWLSAEHDQFFGCSRSFYYELDKRLQAERGEKLLLHVRAKGKKRGVTLIRFAVMEAFVRSLEAQNGEGQ